MALSRIHVNRQVIHKDNKSGSVSKAVGVETSGQRKRYGYAVTINGPSRVVYRPNKPLKCGAKCWMETHAPVTVHRSTR
jgi:hypothetical protein